MADDLPVELRPLLDWYADINRWGRSQGAPQSDQLLGLRGKGRGVWGAEDPDAYIQRLRSTWP